jgi:hypothetical protein
MQAAYEYGLAVQRRGHEALHLWARSGELVDLIPLNHEARAWIHAHGWEGTAIMVQFWCEQLTVQSPLDRRRKAHVRSARSYLGTDRERDGESPLRARDRDPLGNKK